MEEPAMPGCSWTGAIGGQTSQGGGGRVTVAAHVGWTGLRLGRQVNQGMEELREAPAAEEVAVWRSRPCRAAVGSGPLAGGLHRAEAGGCRQAGGRGWMMGQRRR
jgi:hypothetical protein